MGGPPTASIVYSGSRVDTTQPPGSFLIPARSTTILQPAPAPSETATVGYERLAPGGNGYLPTEWLPANYTLPSQQYYAQQPAPPPSQGQGQPAPSTSQDQQLPPPSIPYWQPMLVWSMPGQQPGYGTANVASQPPHPQPQHLHSGAAPVHVPGEQKGTVPYFLPRSLAAPLGFPDLRPAFPTLTVASAEGDVIKISATDAGRWRLELKAEAWDRPIDAVCDTKTATFRLDSAFTRKLKVRVCTMSATGEAGQWTPWKDLECKEGKKEEPPEPAPAPAPAPPAPAPAPAPASATAPPPPAAAVSADSGAGVVASGDGAAAVTAAVPK
jgi:hypothetical protein